MNFIDKTISFINPTKGLKRSQSRLAMTVIEGKMKTFDEKRNFDIASKGRRNNGWLRPETSGAQEASKAFRLAASSAQELTRNNPLALRIKRVWSGNIVGGGISLDVTGSSELKTKKFMTTYEEWAESTDCDFEGHNTFYGLQTLWVDTVVETGGVFIRKHINKKKKFPLQLQTIEQGFLDVSKNGETEDGEVLIDGIQYDTNGQVEGYWLNKEKTNTQLGRPPESIFHSSKNMIHIYRKDRAGQHLGVTWYHSVATTLKNYNTLQDAKLMQQQIAACFALIVENADSEMGVGGDGGGLPDTIEPAMIEYVKAGQKVTTISPPKADSSNAFDVAIKRDIASGVDITYEQLTGDYSLVNFASGRMGKSDFFIQLDKYQQQLIKPKLNNIFSWFVDVYEIKNGGNNNFVSSWTFPSRAAVNPQEEFDVLMSKVRHGMLSPHKAAKQLGEKLSEVVDQWKKDKKLFGELPFDIDPSLFASTGNQLNVDDAASGNAETKTKKEKKVKDV